LLNTSAPLLTAQFIPSAISWLVVPVLKIFTVINLTLGATPLAFKSLCEAAIIPPHASPCPSVDNQGIPLPPPCGV